MRTGRIGRIGRIGLVLVAGIGLTVSVPSLPRAATSATAPVRWGEQRPLPFYGTELSASTSGRHLAYVAHGQVWLADTDTGEHVLVSAVGGRPGNKASSAPHVVADGTGDAAFVVFASAATNLVTGDTNGHVDVFLWRRSTQQIRVVSVASSGALANADAVLDAVMPASYGARQIVWTSRATNLVPGDTNGVRDVFRRDVASATTTRVSTGSDGRQLGLSSFGASLTTDGRRLSLVTGGTGYVKDLATGVRTAVGTLPSGAVAPAVEAISMAGDGRVVAYLAGGIAYTRALPTGRAVVVRANGAPYAPLTVSNDGRLVALTEGGDYAVVFDRWTGTFTDFRNVIDSDKAVLSADGRRLAYPAYTGTAHVFMVKRLS